MKYPLENLTDEEFEQLVARICEKILGTGTIVFSVGKDGGKDAKFTGKANKFPSKAKPWEGKFIIEAKHTERTNASCSDSDFKNIIKEDIIPKIKKLKKYNKVDYYLLFTNRKLSGIQDWKIEDLFDENISVENIVIGLERINQWLQEFSDIAKILNLNRLLLPLDFNENDLKEIINSFSKVNKEDLNIIDKKIPKRNIEKKNKLNKLSTDYFDNVIKKNITYFEQIEFFLEDSTNKKLKNKYLNTINDINAKIILHRGEYGKFESILEYLYDFILNNSPELSDNRRLVRLFLHFMYYYCDIGKNE